MSRKKLTDKKLTKIHNKELKAWELKTKGYTGDIYSFKNRKLIIKN